MKQLLMSLCLTVVLVGSSRAGLSGKDTPDPTWGGNRGSKQVRLFAADYFVHADADEAVTHLQVEPAVAELVALLADEDPDVVAHAATALGKVGPAAKAAVPALVELLDGRRLRPEQRRRVARLISELDSDEFAVRRRAQEALLALGWQARVMLQDALLKRPSAEVQHRLQEVLESATDEELRVLRAVVTALGKIGPAARSAGPALARSLRDVNASVSESAGEALGKVGEIEPLIDALQSTEPHVRTSAAHGLFHAPKTREVLAPLTEALKDSERDVRYFAAAALAEVGEALGSEAESAVPALRALLGDRARCRHGVGEQAQTALNALGQPLDEDQGLKTSLRVDGWDGDRLKVRLSYRWTEGRATWAMMRFVAGIRINFWDAKGRRIETKRRGGDGVLLNGDFREGKCDVSESEERLSVPEGAATLSIGFGRSSLETKRVPIPAK